MGTLTVQARQHGEVMIQTDEETVFRVKDVEDASLKDVQVDDVVAGVVVKQEDGTLLAKLIAVVPPRTTDAP